MLFADSPEACPYGFHRFVIFDQTDKLQFSLPNKFNNITLYKHPFPWYNKALTQKGCNPI